FTKVKNKFQSENQKFEDLHKRSVGKGDFADVFGCTSLRPFTEGAIKAGFAATGVYPLNPDAISE
ncbi:hypothetical protein BYT27DRAFT_7029043, partial [Phlegmacium glaucopus]